MKLDTDKQLELDFEGKSIAASQSNIQTERRLKLIHSRHSIQWPAYNHNFKTSSTIKPDEKIFESVIEHARSLSW